MSTWNRDFIKKNLKRVFIKVTVKYIWVTVL